MQIIKKLKFKSDNFKSSNKSILLFFIYIKVSKNVSAKSYQGNKERLQKIL